MSVYSSVELLALLLFFDEFFDEFFELFLLFEYEFEYSFVELDELVDELQFFEFFELLLDIISLLKMIGIKP